MKACSIFLVCVLASFSSAAAILSVSVATTPAVGKPLLVEIVATGDVGVENGLRKASESLKIKGSKVYDLGTAEMPGFYEFRFRAGEQSLWLVVPILPEITHRPKPVALSRDEESAVLKFLSMHT